MEKLTSGQSTERQLSVEYSATNGTFMSCPVPSVLKDYWRREGRKTIEARTGPLHWQTHSIYTCFPVNVPEWNGESFTGPILSWEAIDRWSLGEGVSMWWLEWEWSHWLIGLAIWSPVRLVELFGIRRCGLAEEDASLLGGIWGVKVPCNSQRLSLPHGYRWRCELSAVFSLHHHGL